ncbi:threonine aldolase [Coprinopsis marcescibilis]|uniref:Threonine aldolase n=1 Tax=Coprinopsis marcescibilis TaxID=230819 RepID=A0A5C3KTE9_COPMA|nr:threonine aldolase [Coprinopsis marcescibilis]
MATSPLPAILSEIKLDLLTEDSAAANAAKRKEVARTFISDTITVPTEDMYAYAVQATLGDDVYHEPSTASLEGHIAKITGKEAALFVPSGTASNQIALRTHLLQPPYSVLLDHRAHINKYEAGGAAMHSGAHVIPIQPENRHHLTLEEIKESVVLGNDVHFAPTRVIALENTLNGSIFPQDEIIRIAEYARSIDVKMHLDGARIWHVAVETQTPLKELCEPFDSISLCFSKGLGAPVGSCLAGPKEFIQKARWFRKIFGGGMRQTGILAASAAYALTNNLPLLSQVHALSRHLEAGLEEIGVRILSRAETCMIFYDPSTVGVTYDEIADRGSELSEPLVLGGSRLVVHIQTSPAAVEDFLSIVRTLAQEKEDSGFVPEEPSENNGVFKDVYVRRAAKVNKT